MPLDITPIQAAQIEYESEQTDVLPQGRTVWDDIPSFEKLKRIRKWEKLLKELSLYDVQIVSSSKYHSKISE